MADFPQAQLTVAFFIAYLSGQLLKDLLFIVVIKIIIFFSGLIADNEGGSKSGGNMLW